jgi:multiple sugar transport system permease protein
MSAVQHGLYALFAVPLARLSVSLAMLLNLKARWTSVSARSISREHHAGRATALVWLWMFNPRGGIINYVLSLMGIRGPGWLGSPAWAKPALILMSLWGVGGAVVIYLAALQDVPRELTEASQLDGANTWQQIRNVTLPMISPVILFNVIGPT